MRPEEFDIDFDFDKEYGYNPNSGSKSAEPDDFDLDAILARELGPDFDALFEEEFAKSQAALNARLAQEQEEPAEAEPAPRFADFTDVDYVDDDEEDPDDEDGSDEEMASIFAAAARNRQQAPEEEPAEEPVEAPVQETGETLRARTERRRSAAPRKTGLDLGTLTKNIDLKGAAGKITLKGVGEKLSGAGKVLGDSGKKFVDALKDCRPGKMDKKAKRRFKDDVLPYLIGGAALVMCLIFIIGSVTRALGSDEREAAALAESIAQAESLAAVETEIQEVLDAAAAKAAGYDYQGAIDTLDGYRNTETGRELTEAMTAARAEYSAALTDLVIWDDPTAITNLSFHVLIEDAARAYANPTYGGSFRSKFVTTAQFSAILDQLYDNGYVLVNLDSCISASTDANGKATYTTKPIYLPAGKTPVMITETLVNYFAYMIDGDGDGLADANGAGFASRLVLENGEIKAEYVDANGQTMTGDYDLVPILNTFIDAHPDFSYRGAKAILGVTGDEGVFGWRTNTGDAAAIAGAQDVVDVLRADGYQIASYSFANLNYGGSTTAEQITADLTLWETQVAPVVGDVDIMIIAKGGEIRAGGVGFQMIQDAGFGCIIDCTDTPSAELTADYFHQHRVMVMGTEGNEASYAPFFTLAAA